MRTLSRTYVNKYGAGKSSVNREKWRGGEVIEVKDEGRDFVVENRVLLLETLLCFNGFQIHYTFRTKRRFLFAGGKKTCLWS